MNGKWVRSDEGSQPGAIAFLGVIGMFVSAAIGAVAVHVGAKAPEIRRGLARRGTPGAAAGLTAEQAAEREAVDEAAETNSVPRRAFVLAAGWASAGAGNSGIPVLIAALVAILGFAAFIAIELRVSEPVVPLRHFANRTILVCIVLSTVIGVGLLVFGLLWDAE